MLKCFYAFFQYRYYEAKEGNAPPPPPPSVLNFIPLPLLSAFSVLLCLINMHAFIQDIYLKYFPKKYLPNSVIRGQIMFVRIILIMNNSIPHRSTPADLLTMHINNSTYFLPLKRKAHKWYKMLHI